MRLDKLDDIIGCDAFEFEWTEHLRFHPRDHVVLKEEAIKRNTEIVTCDRCGTKGGRPNMLRWHFDNCKVHLRNCKHCGNIIPRQGIKDYLYNQKLYCNSSCYHQSKKGVAPVVMTEQIKKKISDKARSRWKK